MAAGGDEGANVRKLVQALQVLRGANAVEVRGGWANEEEARAVLLDFVQVFKLDVVITELDDGFRVELRDQPQRTLRLDF
jgi:GH35 family endo-1,4-beta-xylanase